MLSKIFLWPKGTEISDWPWFSKTNMGRTRREASSKIRSHKYSSDGGMEKKKKKNMIKLDTLIQPGERGTLSLRSLGGKP